MKIEEINSKIYADTSGLVLGFHGCDRSIGEKIVKSPIEHLKLSKNQYDWLGDGIYFWLNDPVRAFEWAEQHPKKSNGEGITEPFVIGAVINLGQCLNLCERSAITALQKTYKELREGLKIIGIDINEKYRNKAPDDGGFALLRPLDCLVINTLIKNAEKEGSYFDTVYGYFQEGSLAFEGAGIREKSHIQICVRNRECIKGYFLPRYK